MAASRRKAVVLFSLGGPDAPEAVEPFLYNLFSDPAIIGLPAPLRQLVARLLARRRAATARNIYAKIGGRSPLLPNTEAQAHALQALLGEVGEIRVFACMRYWHPMSAAVAAAVRKFGADEVVLLPLYPQFSTTTTGSSYKAWKDAAIAVGLDAATKLVCCYPSHAGFIRAASELVRAGIGEAAGAGRPRILFSAHGLPKKIVKRGDPYAGQVNRSARAIAGELGLHNGEWTVCFQSRVGPLEWIGPDTDAEIRRAGADRAPVVLFPIAFVSEHSETLVELDIDYRHLAERSGVPRYVRVPAVGTQPAFIAGLADLVGAALGGGQSVRSQEGSRICAAAEVCCLNPA
jgi:ferrochelatase